MARSSDPKKLVLWQGRLRRFFGSDLSVDRFCVLEHVSVASFYYWRKKIGYGRKKIGRQAPREAGSTPDHNVHPVFQPVTVVPAACGVVVRLPGGTQIEIGAAHVDAIRVVVAEVVRVDRGREVERRSSSTCRTDHQRGGAASC